MSENAAKWEKLPAVEGSVACLSCGCGARTDLEPERVLSVGFGDAGYRKDGVTTSTEPGPDDERDWEELTKVSDVEKLAAADPDHDWRIYFDAPLYNAEYQRQGEGVWVLVEKGLGFA